MDRLVTEIAGVRYRNPVLLASGIWGESGLSLARAYNAGAGAVITKSIGPVPRDGYPNPTVEPLGDWGLLNAMGLPNPGIENYLKEVDEARRAGAVVIGSIFGATAEEFARLARAMEGAGVSSLELNLSCPHAKGLGSEIGQDPHALSEVVKAVKGAVRIPVWAKLTPNTHDPGALAEAAAGSGADAVSAINTVRAMAISAKAMRPVLAHKLGGLSGPAVKPIGLACVWQIYERVKAPIIGIGGITTAEDAFEYVIAGASMVEIGTAVSTRGEGVFREVSKGLDALLKEHGFSSVKDAVGAAHREPVS
jgi:dihydroorotate dehydrogenase (NAD+) catalytic subunit